MRDIDWENEGINFKTAWDGKKAAGSVGPGDYALWGDGDRICCAVAAFNEDGYHMGWVHDGKLMDAVHDALSEAWLSGRSNIDFIKSAATRLLSEWKLIVPNKTVGKVPFFIPNPKVSLPPLPELNNTDDIQEFGVF